MKQNDSLELIIICARCTEQKNLKEMVPDKRRARGHQGYCKECDRKDKIERRAKRTWEERKASNYNILAHRRTGTLGKMTPEMIGTIWKRSNGKCFYCDKALVRDGGRKNIDSFEIDHVIPRIYDFDNLVASCRKCNILKHANTLETLRNFVEKIEKYIAKHPHLLAKTLK